MRKGVKRILICFFLTCFFWCGTLVADRQRLYEELIRLHVVANSDSEIDQAIKLRVRDAVIISLRKAMENVADVEEAKKWLRENLIMIQDIANETLKNAGSSDQAIVSLCKEVFDTRYYDTFTLPAGIYNALRITIGEGDGKNWWCVVFPSLCVPATVDGFEAAAASAGFPDTLNDTLTGKQGYEVRFFLLDALGRLENIFFEE